MTERQQHLLDVVKRIRTEKREKRRFPDFSLGTELSRRLDHGNAYTAREIAEELKIAGLVRIGRTINDYFVELIDDPTAPEDTPETVTKS